MEMELKKMPKRKPPPLPNPRTPQQPNAMSGQDLIRQALGTMLGGVGRFPMAGGNQPLRPTPMVMKRNNKRR
jgi:hypothetical protein